MKKWISVLLTLVMFLGISVNTRAEGRDDTLTVGTTTPFSGNFFCDAFGNNIADRDVQLLIHGCSPVYWEAQNGAFAFNGNVVSGTAMLDDARGNRTYYLELCDDLRFSNGEKITAWDYAFSFLLLCSDEMAEITGNTAVRPEISGCAAYESGKSDCLSGVRVYDERKMSVTIGADYRPYYYEIAVLDIVPYPISEIAPECAVKDDGNGVYISGDFNTDLLKAALTDSVNGYLTHPAVSSGPYTCVSFEGNQVTLKRNPYFKGNPYGDKAEIENIVYRTVKNESMLRELTAGEVDFLARCTQKEVIGQGTALADRGEIRVNSYPRSGYSFLSFCCEKDTVAQADVRRAIAMCLNKDAVADAYVGRYGTRADGDYGIGQWMYQIYIKNHGEEPCKTEENGNPAQILEKAGWTEDEDGIRFKWIDGQKVRLELKLIYPEGNAIGSLLDDNLIAPLREAGISLKAEAVPMDRLLDDYYRFADRDCDMIYLAVNYSTLYDPSSAYDPEEHNTVNNTTGLKDRELYELALAMRRTAPGDTETYIERWQAYQNRWAEVLPLIPVYSNTYYDFYTPSLRNYGGAPEYGWSEAILGAYLGD